jgi:hypothetical protein
MRASDAITVQYEMMSDRRQDRSAAAALRARIAGLERFERWDAEHLDPIEPWLALRIVAAMLRLLPKSSRQRHEDPQYEGVRQMHAALARWDAARHGA